MQFDTDIKCHCLDDFESKLNYVFKDKIFLTLGEDTVIATLNDASQFREDTAHKELPHERWTPHSN